MEALVGKSALRATWLLQRDVDDVCAIEQSTQHPWNRARIGKALNHWDTVGMVVTTPEQVVGWMCYRLHEQFCDVHRIAVHPDYRRAGVGKFLIGTLMSKLQNWQRTGRRHFIRADVPEDMLGAHLFLRALRFEARCLGSIYRFEFWGR